MSDMSINSSAANVYYYNYEQNQAYVMQNNQLVKTDNAVVEDILKNDYDVAVKDGKLYNISDNFEMTPADLSPALSVGGVPALPPTQNVGDVNAPDVTGALNRFADSSGAVSSLLFQQLMTLMQGARNDRETNQELQLSLQSSKITMMRGDLGALEAKHAAENEANHTSFVLNMVSQCATMAVQLTGGMYSAIKKTEMPAGAYASMNVSAAAIETLPAMYKSISYEHGAYKEKGDQDIAQAEYQKQTEIIQAAIDMVKSGAEDAKSSFKNAMQMVQDVAQRQTDNIKAMSI